MDSVYKYDELERFVHASLFSWSVLAISVTGNAISSGQRIAGSKHCDRSPRDEIARSPWNNAPCPIKTVLIFRSKETRVKFTGVQQGNGARARAARPGFWYSLEPLQSGAKVHVVAKQPTNPAVPGFSIVYAIDCAGRGHGDRSLAIHRGISQRATSATSA